MKIVNIFLLIPFIIFSHADDMYLIKGGMTFLPNGEFVKKDLLIDEGQIVLVEDEIGDVGAENIINAEGKYVTPGLVVFSTLGLLEIGSLPQTNDASSNIYNAGFDPSKSFNPFSQAIRLNRSKGVSSTILVPQASGYFSGLFSYTKINSGLKQEKKGPLALLTSFGESYSDSRSAELNFVLDLFNLIRNRPSEKWLYETDNIQFFFGSQND